MKKIFYEYLSRLHPAEKRTFEFEDISIEVSKTETHTHTHHWEKKWQIIQKGWTSTKGATNTFWKRQEEWEQRTERTEKNFCRVSKNLPKLISDIKPQSLGTLKIQSWLNVKETNKRPNTMHRYIIFRLCIQLSWKSQEKQERKSICLYRRKDEYYVWLLRNHINKMRVEWILIENNHKSINSVPCEIILQKRKSTEISPDNQNQKQFVISNPYHVINVERSSSGESKRHRF